MTAQELREQLALTRSAVESQSAKLSASRAAYSTALSAQSEASRKYNADRLELLRLETRARNYEQILARSIMPTAPAHLTSQKPRDGVTATYSSSGRQQVASPRYSPDTGRHTTVGNQVRKDDPPYHDRYTAPGGKVVVYRRPSPTVIITRPIPRTFRPYTAPAEFNSTLEEQQEEGMISVSRAEDPEIVSPGAPAGGADGAKGH